MFETQRRVGASFHIDANRIISKGKLDNMNLLERWFENRVIQMEMSSVAQSEASAGGDPRRATKALLHIATETLATHPDDPAILRKIEEILFPGGARTPDQKNDVEIIFNARKYFSTLVTADGGSKRQPGGILGHKKELAEFGAHVMSDSEAVTHVRHLIGKRDERARRMHEK